ncbi:MAG: 4-hydroxy-tetrahydrodipicolinate reductase [Gemmiger sp.]|nr:4-hydroxy-tetrahydrodipicolinate reductase [Gemmiger sp.]
MTTLIIQGIGGRMGRTLVEKIATRTDCRVLAGVDQQAGQMGDIPIVEDLSELPVPPNTLHENTVLIDFSSPAGAVRACWYGAENNLPCVICSTGLSPEQEATLKTLSAKVAIFRSGNMSLGINVLIELAKKASGLFGTEFDVEIIEKHHHNKLDAPSGTALMIADAINEASGNRYEYIYDRHDVRQKRGAAELGISAVRGGGIIGEHEVLFCGPEEVVTLSHTAQSRGVFADGAIQAALFLAGQKPGYYTMSELIREKL